MVLTDYSRINKHYLSIGFLIVVRISKNYVTWTKGRQLIAPLDLTFLSGKETRLVGIYTHCLRELP